MAEKFIDPEGVGGIPDDGNEGTISSPWETIDGACQQMGAGDILYFRAATIITNDVWPNGVFANAPNGTGVGNETIFRPYQGEVVTFRTTIAGRNVQAVGHNKKYLKWLNFIYDANGVGAHIVRFENNINCGWLTWQGCELKNSPYDSGFQIHGYANGGTVGPLYILDNNVHHCGLSDNQAYALYFGGEYSNSVVSGNLFHDISGAGGQLYEGLTNHLGQAIVKHNITFTKNKIWNFGGGIGGTGTGTTKDGFIFANGNNHTATNNIVFGCQAQSGQRTGFFFGFGGSWSGHQAHHNIIAGANLTHGIYSYNGAHSAKNNIILLDSGTPIIVDGGTLTQEGNLTSGTRSQIFVDADNTIPANRDFHHFNKTITNSSGNWTVAVSSNVATIQVGSAHGFSVGQRLSTNADWADNAFMASLSDVVIASVPTSSSFTIPLTHANQGATAETTTTATLRAVSKTVNVPGLNLAGVPDDYDGVGRPQGLLDQGAYELVSASAGLWSAALQIPSGAWIDSGISGHTVRFIMRASAWDTSVAAAFKLVFKGRTDAAYTIEKVSVVECDGATLNGVDATNQQVTFGGTWAAGGTVPQDGELISDTISLALDESKDYFVTFYASGSVGQYLDNTGGATNAWMIAGDDATDIDWGAKSPSQTWPHVYSVTRIEETTDQQSPDSAPSFGGVGAYVAVPGTLRQIQTTINDINENLALVTMLATKVSILVDHTLATIDEYTGE